MTMADNIETVEKRPGADWNVFYMDVADDGARYSMTVFGCHSARDAIDEALSSFDEPETIEIVAVQRDAIDLAEYHGVKG